MKPLRRIGVDRRLFRFTAVGISNTLITILSYTALVELDVPYPIAATLGYAAGVVNGYTWNRLWTFEVGPAHLPEFFRYVAVQAVGLAANLLLLFLFIEQLGVAHGIAEIVAVVPIVLLTYSGNRWWTFNSARRTPETAKPRAGRPRGSSNRA